ncbi:MAG: FecR family protein [Steroidobacteraceae bacterium]
MVTKVENQAQIGTETAVVGTLVHKNDELRTGAKSRLEVTFRDQTKFTLGENAKVVVDRYVFNPEASTGELALKTGVAAFRLATGKLSEMRNKNITVSAPVAAMAVRGTDFWWGPIDGHFGVLLVSNSKLDVHNEAGAVMLAKSGEGTDIDPLKGGGGPGRPYLWPPEKVARALATTSFAVALGPTAPTAVGVAAVAAAAAVGATVTAAPPPSPPPRPASP